MNSDRVYSDAFVWIWLPGRVDPVVAGKLFSSGNQLLFHYGRSYLARPDAIPIYEPELPLTTGVLSLLAGLKSGQLKRNKNSISGIGLLLLILAQNLKISLPLSF